MFNFPLIINCFLNNKVRIFIVVRNLVNSFQLSNSLKITFPDSEYPLLLRTDFSNDTAWETIKKKVTSPDNEYEAVVTFIDDRRFENLALEQLPSFDTEQDKHDFVFIADSLSMHGQENTILCVDLAEDYGKHFRVIPSRLWSVANNLFITNMEFNEFAESVDLNGVFRGF